VALWLAERVAEARGKAEDLVARLDQAVRIRVQLGGAPEVESVRSNALRLRAHADAVQTAQLVRAAAADLGRWIGASDASELRTSGDPAVPIDPPPLSGMLERVGQGPAVARERAAARAAQARADRERALVRPALTLDVGMDARDPALPATNYRAQLGIELPLFTQRAPYVQREDRSAAAAELRAHYQMATLSADLLVAYRTFEAATASKITLEQAGIPAARAAARSTEESYSLGRASLEAVLDADRTLIDVELSFLDTSAARANSWIDVEHAMGVK
jgi:outer membrane protein TolC